MALLLRPRTWSAGQVAWVVMLSLLVVPALVGGTGDALSREVLSWRPDRVWQEPWRWWSAAWLHLNDRHLAANLGGALLVGALGWLLQMPRQMAWAWGLAWPLTHLSLLLAPDLQRYVGLSGVLHAGVAVCGVWMLSRRGGRGLGLLLAAGLLLKLLLERAWLEPMRLVVGWDIVIAPLAHATGVVWGVLCAALMLLYASSEPD